MQKRREVLAKQAAARKAREEAGEETVLDVCDRLLRQAASGLAAGVSMLLEPLFAIFGPTYGQLVRQHVASSA